MSDKDEKSKKEKDYRTAMINHYGYDPFKNIKSAFDETVWEKELRELHEALEKAKLKCECGAHKTRDQSFREFHADYCPLFVEEKI